MEQPRDAGMWPIAVIALVVGVVVAFGLVLWHNGHQPTAEEAAATAQADLADTFARLSVGAPIPPEADAPQEAWPVRHPWASGVVVAIVVLVIGRVVRFMQRVEAGNRRA